MNLYKTQNLLLLGLAGVIFISAVRSTRTVRSEGRGGRKQVLDEMGLDVAAIHNATDVVNGRIERGEIRTREELHQAVITEVAFQKMAIREQ